MEWTGWWRPIWFSQAEDWVFGYLEPSQILAKLPKLEQTEVKPNSAYLSIFLQSMRVVNVRKGLTKFYGTVHSFISLPHISGKQAKFHVLTTPADLSDIDAKNVDRVLKMNHRLLGPIPYRGGDLNIEIGLFSIKSADLAQPFLNVLGSMSKAAGVAYINIALPFVQPLLDGVNQLTGADGDSILEIGLAKTFPKVKTGTLVVMRAPKDSIKLKDLHLDEDYRLLDADKKPVKDYPYIVLAIESDPKRDNWFEIPELSQSYGEIQSALRTGKYDETIDCLTVFKRVAITCPDLQDKHARNLIKEVEKEVNQKLAYVQTSKGEIKIRELEQINIF